MYVLSIRLNKLVVMWKLWVKLIRCVVVLFKYTITWLLTLNQKLRELQTHVAAMKASCNEAETQLALTNQSSKMLLEQVIYEMKGKACFLPVFT
jgi:hypothetical protein